MSYKKYISFLSHNTHGQLLIEILVAIALSSILLPALLTGIVSSRSGKAQQGQRVQAVALMKETEEAIRSIRERKWDNFATNGTYHPSITGTEWTLTSGTEIISGFTRSILISDINRDTNGIVVTPPSGIPDPSTKKIDIAITWTTPYSSSVNSTMYITRFTNTTTLQTTEADFTAGSTDDTFITNTSGGEVILGAGGGGNWCNPNLSIAALDLPKQGVADAITAIEGRSFVGTGENSSGVSFANVNISNTNPPVATVAGTFDGYKTNGVFGETNYAYIATDNNKKEVVIIDLTQKDGNGKYIEAGHFEAPDKVDGKQIWVSGNTGYLLTNKKLYSFDLSSKNGSRPIKDPNGVGLGGDGTRIVVVGNYAYITIKEGPNEMKIVDVSNPNNMIVVGQANLTNKDDKDAKDLFVNTSGTRAYIVTKKDDDRPEFFIVDVSTKTGNRPTIGTYEANGMNPKALTVVTGNKAIIAGTGGEEYQVINISSETTPVRCGGLQLNTKDIKVNGISSVLEADGDAYSYIMTAASDSEFKIIAGGVGGQFSTSGTFTSKIFDASASAAFNRIVPVFTQPSQTTVRFQVAVAPPVSNSCSSSAFSFLGPDGTTSSYFTGSGQIPLITSGTYTNPGRCFQYKVFLDTTDASQTPIFQDMTVNYSP